MVAGEASGDLHGAHVIRELKKCCANLVICGVGGAAMKAAGAQILFDSDQLAVVGVTEVLFKAINLLKARSRLKRLLLERQPDLIILIDFPDFNLHLAATAKKRHIPVLYYISPQIWAWRASRVKKIKARVDHMAVILPFEKVFYEKNNIPVSFVGHPLMDNFADLSLTDNRPTEKDVPTVGLLPGSRDREVSRLLPCMLEAAQILENRISPIRFVVSCAPSIDPSAIQDIVERYPLKDSRITRMPVRQLFAGCRLVVAASGTVTLEAAICGVPMIITYVVSPLSYGLAKILVEVEHIGLVNLIAGKRIVPELVQKQVSAGGIAEAAYPLLSDQRAHDRMRGDLLEVRRKLGRPGASKRVARIACDLMGSAHAVKKAPPTCRHQVAPDRISRQAVYRLPFCGIDHRNPWPCRCRTSIVQPALHICLLALTHPAAQLFL